MIGWIDQALAGVDFDRQWNIHNFINQHLAQHRLGCGVQYSTAFDVLVADGNHLACMGCCNGLEFTLGIQWL